MSNKFKKTGKALKSIQFAKVMKDLKLAVPEVTRTKEEKPGLIDFSQLFFKDFLSREQPISFKSSVRKFFYEKNPRQLDITLPGIARKLNQTAFMFINNLLQLRSLPGHQSSLIQNFIDAEAEYCLENDFYMEINNIPNETQREKLIYSISPYVVFGQDLNDRDNKKFIWDQIRSCGSMHFRRANYRNYASKQVYGFKVLMAFNEYDLSLKKHIRDAKRSDVFLMRSKSENIIELNLEMDSDDSSNSLVVMDINQKFGYPSKFVQK